MAICRSIDLFKYIRSARHSSQLLTRSLQPANRPRLNYKAFSTGNLSYFDTQLTRQSTGSVRGSRAQFRSISISSFSRSQVEKSEHEKGKSGKSILALQPNDFVDFLKEKKISRCYIVYDKRDGKVKVSHPELEEFGQFLKADEVDYDNHEGVFMQVGRRSGCLMGAFVWRTNRGQACGGIRLWDYPHMEKYIRDGLRLGQGMGVKSALAGLWAGGGKGVVQRPRGPEGEGISPELRVKMFYDYGDLLSSLNGCYVAAEDVGLNVSDLDNVHMFTRYTTCISEDKGGSGNPSVATGKGVICAMEGALDFLGLGNLAGKSVAIQGAGNVSTVIVEGLLQKDVSHIYVTDCHSNRVNDMKDRFYTDHSSVLTIEKVPLDDNGVLAYPCDIVSPCALGNVLNEHTIPTINARIVCGAANNQLGSPIDNQLMKQRGITYIVDYLANRMGIVNCANEAYGRLPDDPAITRHFGREWENAIYVMTKRILQKATDEDITPVEAANSIADKLSMELHPIWPNRSQQIINALVDNEWHLQPV